MIQCSQSSISLTQTIPEDTSCDVQAFIDQIIRLFKASSPCESDLPDILPAFWELAASEACFNTYLRYLIVKRETVLLLMGCEVSSIDTYDRHRQLDANTVADSFNDFRSQSQSTGNSTRFNKGHGETRFDEASNGESNGRSVRTGRASEVGDGTSFYRDDGRGSGFNNSGSTNEIEALEQRQHLRTVGGASTEIGNRRDCNYEFSRNETHGTGAAVGAPFIVAAGLISGGFTGTGSEWRKYTRTQASDSDSSFRQVNHGSIHEIRDERKGAGSHGWESVFFADIEWHERDFEVRRDRDRSDTRRHAEAHSRGTGDGFSEERIEAHNAAQGTTKIVAHSEATRTIRHVDTMTTLQLANSQRFANLRLIYDQLSQQISLEKKRIRQRVLPRIAELGCNCEGCCTCGPSSRLRAHGVSSHHCDLLSMGRQVVGMF